MKIVKYVFGIASIIFLFINWKIAIGLFLVSSIIHVIPLGPNVLLGVVTGYLIIGGLAYLYSNWMVGVILIISAFLIVNFRIWGNKKNYEYYHKKKEIEEEN